MLTINEIKQRIQVARDNRDTRKKLAKERRKAAQAAQYAADVADLRQLVLKAGGTWPEDFPC